MATTLAKRARDISARVAALSNTPSNKKRAVISPYLRTRPINTDVKIIEKPLYFGKPGEAGPPGKSVKGDPGRPGKDGLTPVKGQDYLTPTEIAALKREIMQEVRSVIPEEVKLPDPLEINSDFVKKIVQLMHALPENDKLEVSKGLRNAQSFIYGNTRYKTSELMHGGANTQAVGVPVTDENVAAEGSGTIFTLAHTPVAGTLKLYRGGSRITTVNGDYTLSGATITLAFALQPGETLTADYNWI